VHSLFFGRPSPRPSSSPVSFFLSVPLPKSDADAYPLLQGFYFMWCRIRHLFFPLFLSFCLFPFSLLFRASSLKLSPCCFHFPSVLVIFPRSGFSVTRYLLFLIFYPCAFLCTRFFLPLLSFVNSNPSFPLDTSEFFCFSRRPSVSHFAFRVPLPTAVFDFSKIFFYFLGLDALHVRRLPCFSFRFLAHPRRRRHLPLPGFGRSYDASINFDHFHNWCLLADISQ